MQISCMDLKLCCVTYTCKMSSYSLYKESLESPIQYILGKNVEDKSVTEERKRVYKSTEAG